MVEIRLDQALFRAVDEFPLRDITAGEVLGEAARRWPGRPALVEAFVDGTSGRRWTYAELFAEARRLAGRLSAEFRPGERIGLWAPNAPEWVLIEFAAALAGLTLVTINPSYVERELEYVLAQSQAAGLFLVRTHRGNPMWDIANRVAARLPALRVIVDIEERDSLFGTPAHDAPLPEVAAADPAQIQYTSGTTGFPKGVVLLHYGLVNNARHFTQVVGIPDQAVTLAMTPLFHTTGCAMGVLGTAQSGGPLVLLRQFDADAALDLIEREKVAATIAVPTMLIAMVAAQQARPRDLSSLAVIVSGGAMVAPELARQVERLFGCRLQIVYGQTESSPLLTAVRPGDREPERLTSVGRPMPSTDLGIFEPAGTQIVGCGDIGEIRARSYAVMIGYNGDREATAKAIDGDGWLHTGDLGTMDQRGYVRITGRVKEMIIRGAENLFPAEIENVLLEHADVAEVAVVGVPDAVLGEAVAAFIRLAPGAALDPPRLKDHCRQRMSAQKTPAHWVAVEAMPMTGSGKVQKFALRDQWVAANPA